MKRRTLYGSGVVLLAILVGMVVWQGSFALDFVGEPRASQALLLWAVSTLIFILTMTLGFMLIRTGVRLYIERQKNAVGSRLKTKLVVGALALSITPVIFLVLFSISVLNHNINKWFSRPIDTVLRNLTDVSLGFDQETRLRAEAQAAWLATSAQLQEFLRTGKRPAGLCTKMRIAEALLLSKDGTRRSICQDSIAGEGGTQRGAALIPGGEVVVLARASKDLAAMQRLIGQEVQEYQILSRNRKEFRWAYILLLLLISLFILFIATWIALVLSRQISVPIAALLEAAGQLRSGNLGYRINIGAIDELGTLIRAFNGMSADLESSEKELERRRRFTEAILESIPTGVISLSAERRIQRVNSALVQMLTAERVARAATIDDLFPAGDAREIHYLLNRASRVGLASAQLDISQGRHVLHLAITVAALAGRHTSGWVLVLEDTSELLRAQKAAAWHEVARRIAHELKNPLTPIALSAERIARQVDKLAAQAGQKSLPPEVIRILKECSLTISGEVESVKVLVDEFSQFARFPAAQPAPADLNQVVEAALAVFQGRLAGVTIETQLEPDLPAVAVDREQFKRVLVNLIDNAAEAMQDSPVQRLAIATRLAGSDSIEMVVADTGCGITPEDCDRLFLPYFSTKNRGTGLGLAIVHHILSEHGAQIHVDSKPGAGSRFTIEIPIPTPAETADRAQEQKA